MKTRYPRFPLMSLSRYRVPSLCAVALTIWMTNGVPVNAQDTTIKSTGSDIESLEESEARLKQMEDEVMKSLSKSPAKSDTAANSLPSAPAKPVKSTKAEIAETALPTTPKESLVKLDRPSSQTSSLKQLEKDLSSTPDKPKVARSAGGGRDVEQKLEIAESQVSILTRELNTMRRSLESSERRVEELVRINREGGERSREFANRRGNGEYEARVPNAGDDDPATLGDAQYYKGHTVPITSRSVPPSQVDGGPSSSEFATVVSRKAPLRTGPGRSESALMMIPRDSVVNIELRTGNWYRVVTTGGNRGWLAGDSLEFQIEASPDSAVRVGPVRMAYEPTGIKY
jgi:hypothetical protein